MPAGRDSCRGGIQEHEMFLSRGRQISSYRHPNYAFAQRCCYLEEKPWQQKATRQRREIHFPRSHSKSKSIQVSGNRISTRSAWQDKTSVARRWETTLAGAPLRM